MYEQPIYEEMFDTGFEAIGFATSLGIYMLVFSLIGLTLYILGSLGAHTIAKRRNIRHAWLAWLPIGNAWIWGCISDQFRYVTRGEVRNRRKVLLGLSIAVDVLLIAMIVLYVKLLIAFIADMSAMEPVAGSSPLGLSVTLMFVALATMVVAVVQAVFAYMALYDLFRSCDPDNAVLFLVLSIVFSNLSPIFIFAVRNRDLGMPPRRSTDPENFQPYEQ